MNTSFKSVSNYFEHAESVCSDDPVFVFVGNKCDLDNSRKVKVQELKDKAEEHDVTLHFETSAYPEYSATIETMFKAVIDKVATRIKRRSTL